VGTDPRPASDSAPTSVGVLLDGIAQFLAGPDVPPARADARDLIAAILDRPRFWPTANRELVLEDELAARIVAAAEKLKGCSTRLAARPFVISR
jgi:hypothetical protein